MMRAALVLSLPAACSGLGAQMSWPHKSLSSSSALPEQLQAKEDSADVMAKFDAALKESAPPEEGLKLGAEGGDMDSPEGKRGRKVSSGGKGEPDWVGYQAAKAELQAVEAREEAAEAERIAVKTIGSDMSDRQLEAKDRVARAEFRAQTVREGKLEGLVDNFEKDGDRQDRDVSGMVRSAEALEAKTQKMRAQEEKKMLKMAKEEDAEDAAEEASYSQDARRAEKLDKKVQKEEAQVEKVQAKEVAELTREYEVIHKTNKRNLAEAEKQTKNRLWEEADGRRKSSAEGARLETTEVADLLDVTQYDLDKIKNELNEKASDSTEDDKWGAKYDDKIETLGTKSVFASAQLVESIRLKAEEFVSHHKDIDNGRFVHMLTHMLNETWNDIQDFRAAHSGYHKRIVSDMSAPDKFTSALSLAINGVMSSVEFNNHFAQFDADRLSVASKAEACDQLGGMMAAHMQPAYRRLARMQELLDRMSKVLPSLAVSEKATQKLGVRSNIMLNIAYAETFAYKEGATIFASQVAPAVSERLKCTFSGAFARASLSGAAAAIAAVAGWLAL